MMPNQVVAVLVVPAKGDPGGLLTGGFFSSWPPTALRVGTFVGVTWCATVSSQFDPDYDRALVLWWNGSLVPEGWDRARRVYGRHGWDTPEYDPKGQMGIADPALAGVDAIADGLVRQGLASRIVRLVRDESGRLLEAP